MAYFNVRSIKQTLLYFLITSEFLAWLNMNSKLLNCLIIITWKMVPFISYQTKQFVIATIDWGDSWNQRSMSFSSQEGNNEISMMPSTSLPNLRWIFQLLELRNTSFVKQNKTVDDEFWHQVNPWFEEFSSMENKIHRKFFSGQMTHETLL